MRVSIYAGLACPLSGGAGTPAARPTRATHASRLVEEHNKVEQSNKKAQNIVVIDLIIGWVDGFNCQDLARAVGRAGRRRRRGRLRAGGCGAAQEPIGRELRRGTAAGG